MMDKSSPMYEAVAWADLHSGIEVVGVIWGSGAGHGGHDGSRGYIPLQNVARNPAAEFTMDVHEMITELARRDLLLTDVTAVFHSHPGGRIGPSDQDVEFHPGWLCKRSWVYTAGSTPGIGALVAYDGTGIITELTGALW